MNIERAERVRPWDEARFQAVRKLEDAARNQGQVVLMNDAHTFARVAVKQMPNSWVQRSNKAFNTVHPNSLERPWQDIGAVRYLNGIGYPYVCDFLGVFRDAKTTYVATSLATEGDLFGWCTRDPQPGEGRLEAIRPVVSQIFAAVRQLHEVGIIHGDLSLENMLLTETRSGLQLKLIDFGMSSLQRVRYKDVRGKLSYQAPEMHSDGACDGYLTDAFAVGVSIFSMACNDYPWMSTKPGGCKSFDYVRTHGFGVYLRQRRRRGSKTKQVMMDLLDDSFFKLVEGLVQVDHRRRTTLGEQDWPLEGVDRRSVWDFDWTRGCESVTRKKDDEMTRLHSPVAGG